MFGQYQVIERIAVGGMAEIYLGMARGVEGFERPVVIKKVRRRYSKEARFRTMLVREAKIMASLHHANVVQILDLGRNDLDEYFIVLEYVAGRDLRSVMDTGTQRDLPLDTDLALYVVTEVCAALDYAHNKTDEQRRALNLIHRDVSPANILISYTGEVKLTDFGIARFGREVSQVGALRGKLAYMSPEQARGEPLTRCTDIYSLGAVLYEMVTGRRAFSADNERDLLDMVRAGRLTAPSVVAPTIPSALEKIVQRAMEREPMDRYQSADELGAALKRFQFHHSSMPVGPEQLAELMGLLFREQTIRTAPLSGAALRLTAVAEFVSDTVAEDHPSTSDRDRLAAAIVEGGAESARDLTPTDFSVGDGEDAETTDPFRPLLQPRAESPRPALGGPSQSRPSLESLDERQATPAPPGGARIEHRAGGPQAVPTSGKPTVPLRPVAPLRPSALPAVVAVERKRTSAPGADGPARASWTPEVPSSATEASATEASATEASATEASARGPSAETETEKEEPEPAVARLRNPLPPAAISSRDTSPGYAPPITAPLAAPVAFLADPSVPSPVRPSEAAPLLTAPWQHPDRVAIPVSYGPAINGELIPSTNRVNPWVIVLLLGLFVGLGFGLLILMPNGPCSPSDRGHSTLPAPPAPPQPAPERSCSRTPAKTPRPAPRAKRKRTPRVK